MKSLYSSCRTMKLKNQFHEVVEFLKMIDEPNRLKILCLLRSGEQCVCDIWKKLGLPQNLTSHHLKVLHDFGLIVARQEGRKVMYSSNTHVIKKYTLLVHNFFVSNL